MAIQLGEAFGLRVRKKMIQINGKSRITKRAFVSSRPEHELLISCATTQLDELTTQEIAVLLQEDLDWEYIIGLARTHWITPLLYWNVSKVNANAVPTSRLEQLREHFRENAQRNLFLTGELVKLLKAFAASGIRAVPYKGPILAQFAYENIALRTFSDLDILVDRHDLDAAERQLRPLCYEPYERLNRAQQKIRLLSGYEGPFINRSNAAEVEIHWAAWKADLARTPSQSELWGRASVVTLFGTNVAIPSPEDMTLLSAIHGTKHVWTKLQLICDIAELIRAHPTMNWHLLMERARELGNERMLLVGVQLARDLVNSVVPPKIQRQARDDTIVAYLATQIERRLFQDPQSVQDPERVRSVQFSDLPYILRSKERLADQFRSVLTLMMLPTLADYDSIPLPTQLIGLYLVVHPILIMKRYLRRDPRGVD